MSGAAPEFRAHMAALMARIHDDTTAWLERLDGVARFREDRWERPGGGGGVTRAIAGGALFEKGGVNRSVVEGVLAPEAVRRLGAAPTETVADGERRFFATGVSLVLHPRSPMVPTVHLNVRYFELTDAAGAPVDAWFGGGTDLTPTYPFPEDAAHFHRTLRDLCSAYDPTFYPRFKAWCDDYFVNAHRGGERRGVGGIFYDHLRPAAEDSSREALAAFTEAVGRVLPAAYGPIVERRRGLGWGERERRLQLLRRGRYAEFNLVHDRGTVFGLQTDARIESVLMSLPPLAAWEYAPVFEQGSIEAGLHAMLEPRDWVDERL